MCPTRLTFVMIISIVYWLSCSCLFCVVCFWFPEVIRLLLVVWLLRIPVFLFGWGGIRLVLLPCFPHWWFVLCTHIWFLLPLLWSPGSHWVLRRMLWWCRWLWWGGWTRRMLVVGWVSLKVFMASWMFSVASWYGMWLLVSLVPVMMARCLFRWCCLGF